MYKIYKDYKEAALDLVTKHTIASQGKMEFNSAVNAAQVTIQALINNLPSCEANPPNLPCYEGNKEWWQEVFKELIKL